MEHIWTTASIETEIETSQLTCTSFIITLSSYSQVSFTVAVTRGVLRCYEIRSTNPAAVTGIYDL